MAAGLATTVVIPYAPRPLQRVLHDALDRHRFSVAVCHRRFGKTVLAVNQLIKAAVTCQKPRPRFAYIAPTYKQGKAVAWDYLKHYSAPIPGVEVNESELRVDLPNGAQIRIYGADNEGGLRGIYLDGVVMDEYALMSHTVWEEVVFPTLTDRGGWAFFIGTPNGHNQFYELVHGSKDGSWAGAKNDPSWFFAEYKASQTHVFTPDELALIRTSMTTDAFEQEYECSFEASVKGAVFAREMQACRESGRITRVAFEPKLAVDTAWDLGMGDATAIWLSQTVGRNEVRLIGYYENSGHALHHYVGVLRDLAAKYGFTYGDHWLPHDAEVRELGTGQSRIEALNSMKVQGVFRVAARLSLDDGLNAVRMMLPKCWFNETACEKGIEALKHYRWATQTENATGPSRPVHDWASHGADALRTLASAPEKAAALIGDWNRKRKDTDLDDWRYGKGRRVQVGRGGW